MKRPVATLDDAETLRQLVRSLQEGIYITDQDGKILDANPACLEIFGLSSLEAARRSRIQDLVDPVQYRLEREVIALEGRVRCYELSMRRPDGGQRTVLDTCTGVVDGERTLYHGVLYDISHRKALERRLEEMSLRDPLTGCYNRRYLVRLRQRLETREACFGALVLDVDDFKSYNDRLGHQAGDSILQHLAAFLGDNLRTEDAVVRWGGDEFLLLLFRETDEAVEEVARRLCQLRETEELPPFSIGWAARTAEETLDQTIARADHALLSVRARERHRRLSGPVAAE